MDLDGILANYENQTTLMGEFPAKDIIKNLTKVAKYVAPDYAPAIVNFVCAKIKHVAPSCKLALFYLMDSIMKNNGGQYIFLFGQRISSLFHHCTMLVITRLTVFVCLYLWCCV